MNFREVSHGLGDILHRLQLTHVILFSFLN